VSDGIAAGPQLDETHSQTWISDENFHTCKLKHLLPTNNHSQQLFPEAFLPANTLAQVFGDLTTKRVTKNSRSKHATLNLTNIYQKMAPSLCDSHLTVIILLASVSNLEILNGRKSSVFF